MNKDVDSTFKKIKIEKENDKYFDLKNYKLVNVKNLQNCLPIVDQTESSNDCFYTL